MKPTSSDAHVNAPLTNISTAYLQQAGNYISGRVFPGVPVPKQSDLFFRYGKDDWFRDDAKERAPSTESAGGGFSLSTGSYAAKVFAFHKDVDDQLRGNADAAINPDRDATEYVSQVLAIRKDKQWAANYFVAGVWGLDLTGVPGVPAGNQFQQWDQALSVPINDIKGEIIRVAEATGYKPNKLVLGTRTFNALVNHSSIVDRYKHVQQGIITEALLAQVFGVEEVLVAWATHNTAAEGAALPAMSFISNSKAALLVYANPTPSLMKPSGGYTFNWTGLLGSGTEGSRIKRFRMEQLESDRIEGEMAWDHKLVAADVGTFFSSAIA